MIRGATAIRAGLGLVLAIAIVWVLTHRQMFGSAELVSLQADLGIWAPAAFVLLYATGTVLFLSGALLSLAGGALFGPVWGTVWNLTGALAGATLAFLIARIVGGDWIRRRLGGRMKRIDDGVAAEGWRFVALVRLVPLVPFTLVNYALGLTRISLAAYVTASAICMLPGALAYTWIGYAGRSAAGGGSALRYALLGLGAFGSMAFLPRLLRRFGLLGAVSPDAGKPQWIEAAALKHRLANGDSIVLVDVRQPEEYGGPDGHLPGAINIPLATLPEWHSRLAGKNLPVVMVCKTHRRSALAAAQLLGAGLPDVTVLRDGTDGWNRQGLILERTVPPVRSR